MGLARTYLLARPLVLLTHIHRYYQNTTHLTQSYLFLDSAAKMSFAMW